MLLCTVSRVGSGHIVWLRYTGNIEYGHCDAILAAIFKQDPARVDRFTRKRPDQSDSNLSDWLYGWTSEQTQDLIRKGSDEELTH